MAHQHVWNALAYGTAALALTACGESGGGVNPIAAAPLTPTPTPTPASVAVDIFQNPATQEFATVGTGDPLRIRYDAASHRYEVMAGTRGWDALVDDDNSSPLPGNPNVNFDFAGMPQSFFMIRAHYTYPPDYRYRYSNLAAWAVPAAGGQAALAGTTAFGIATPAGAVPTSGSASFEGLIEGLSTETGPWGWDKETVPAWVSGSVLLTFNFGSGSLTGELRPYLVADKRYDIGTIAFAKTVFGIGSQTFTGSFDTNVTGANSFSGRFTGPNAEELIGKWVFPYLSPINGAPQSGSGAMIAKRP